jgi:hypothetical protein
VADRELPNFGVLLGPFIDAVPEEARPAFLARLERGAAERYRQWAAAAPEHAESMLACAAREDEIADRVDRLFPATDEQRAKIEAGVPGARDAYYAVFAGLPLTEQWRIQADAERQGAAAWRGIAAQSDDGQIRSELEACARLEETSAERLEQLLSAS